MTRKETSVYRKKSVLSACNVDYRLKRSGSKNSGTLCDSSFIYSILELDLSRTQATYKTVTTVFCKNTSVTLSLLDFGRIKETYSIEAILFHEKLFIELQIVQELYSFTGVNENFDSK